MRDDKPTSWRASFEGYRIDIGDDPNSRIEVPPVKGPFIVEVFSERNKFFAKMIPTHVKFRDCVFSEESQAKRFIEQKFMTKTEDWKAVSQ